MEIMKSIFCITNFKKKISRGGLTVPSSSLADFTCDCFAILDFVEIEFKKTNITAREAATLSYIGIY